MDVADKIISLEGIDLLNFSGINDQNLNLIKDYFDSTIVLRGDTIFLKGETDELKVIEKVFNELIFLPFLFSSLSFFFVLLINNSVQVQNI